VEATNQHMARLSQLLEHQKRFVRDTSHQLRTPLAVLKTQLQSAQRGDVAPQQAFAEIAHTVERATELANQMLALAKVEQLKQDTDAPVTDWAEVVRTVALDLAPLIAERALDFSITTQSAPVRSHAWALRELGRNLLHNAVKHTPPGAALTVTLGIEADQATLCVSDCGPGISSALRQRLFQPFATEAGHSNAESVGLGLAICHGIAQSLGGRIGLNNREQAGRIVGLDAWVSLPIAPPQTNSPKPSDSNQPTP
jgi:two-component system sensor histidine kinase TctE